MLPRWKASTLHSMFVPFTSPYVNFELIRCMVYGYMYDVSNIIIYDNRINLKYIECNKYNIKKLKKKS